MDLAGTVTPVIDMRLRCGAPARPMRLADHLVVAKTPRRTVALLVDEALGVTIGAPQDIVPGAEILPGLNLVAGAVKLADGLILIHDLDRLLSLDDGAAIDRALGSASAGTEPTNAAAAASETGGKLGAP